MPIAAVAVGLMPALTILSSRSIAHLLHRVLWPGAEGGGRSSVERAHGDRLDFQLHEAEAPARTGLLTAAVCSLIREQIGTVPR